MGPKPHHSYLLLVTIICCEQIMVFAISRSDIARAERPFAKQITLPAGATGGNTKVRSTGGF